MKSSVFLFGIALLPWLPVQAQERMQTGSRKPMPQKWIDQEIGHKSQLFTVDLSQAYAVEINKSK